MLCELGVWICVQAGIEYVTSAIMAPL